MHVSHSCRVWQCRAHQRRRVRIATARQDRRRCGPAVGSIMLSLFRELKRRNVFRVGTAYLAVAWLLIQVTDAIVPALHMPDWITTAVVVTTLLGLPLALVLA